MRDYPSLGPVPLDEECAQLGTPDYPEKAKKECRRYKELLLEKFGLPPGGAFLAVKGFQHDFGTYYEVCVIFDDESAEAVDYAYMLEANSPETWKG